MKGWYRNRAWNRRKKGKEYEHEEAWKKTMTRGKGVKRGESRKRRLESRTKTRVRKEMVLGGEGGSKRSVKRGGWHEMEERKREK